MAIVIKPPERILIESFSIFLAGSIEGGTASDWQSVIERELDPYRVTILNPRRNDWDIKWEAKQHNPKFRQQVEWELDGLSICDMIFMYFEPGTISRISLLELGKFSESGKMLVCCPEGYASKGNVDIVCERDLIPVENDFERAIDLLVGVAKEASKNG